MIRDWIAVRGLRTCPNHHPTLWPHACPVCKADKPEKSTVTLMGGHREKNAFHGLRNGKPGQSERLRKRREEQC